MNRRNFLKSLGALGLAPVLPIPALASANQASAFTASHYQWAEGIARAQNRCSTNQLQTALGLPKAAAEALKSKLMENGVIHGYADATGFHRAAKPLYENLLKGYVDPTKFVSRTVSDPKPLESVSQDQDALNSDFKTLEETDDSDSELEEIEPTDTDELESSLQQPI